MQGKLWSFKGSCGDFISRSADKIKSLYFPLANENLMSSLSPDLHGDIKSAQNNFLLTPVSRTDLSDSRSSRNFWIYINPDKIWSATGVSKDLRQIKEDKFALEAGLLWHKVNRTNQKIGLKAEILSFVPASGEPVEIMQVKITNISKQKIRFIPTAAIPIYGRSADNLRDHRHVTSLLQRITLDTNGVVVCPTLSFDENGHRPNKTAYFVLGCAGNALAPQYIYPTHEIFCTDAGDLEAPQSVFENKLPEKNAQIQGREAMGAMRFAPVNLSSGKSCTYIILMGITQNKKDIRGILGKFNSCAKVQAALQNTKKYWLAISDKACLDTGNADFDNWLRWVSIQPNLRKIYGCSFLPDFDYGKGGRGWRDLWQDCLSLILNDPAKVRGILVNNFSGVRLDGSNATIIGKNPGEFIADRNNISRVWMDHGVWPLLTLDLYLNKTGDYSILFEKAAYFSDHQSLPKNLRGTVLEHILLQHLTRFFNVGRHNHLRLEGADWNDGLDMARENGESVAFSCMYAFNLGLLADLLEKTKAKKITVAREIKILLDSLNYDNVKAKRALLEKYLEAIKTRLLGKTVSIDSKALIRDLREKSEWMKGHIRKSEWLKEGFYNGYYDNSGRRVEGRFGNLVRMTLAGQTFAIMSSVATDKQIPQILKSVKKYLFDKKLKGYHLNTDFKQKQHDLGRAFSFVYGDKENGAFFNHMTVIFAHSLYQRGFTKEAREVLGSIYHMAMDTSKSKIYPCLPEYFDAEGRGMYSYLTGSASWFILTLLKNFKDLPLTKGKKSVYF